MVSDARATFWRMQAARRALPPPSGPHCVFISLSPSSWLIHASSIIDSCSVPRWGGWWADRMLADRCGCKLVFSWDRRIESEDKERWTFGVRWHLCVQLKYIRCDTSLSCSLTPCWIFFSSFFLLPSFSSLYLLPSADFASSSHFTRPPHLCYVLPLLHYSIFHSDYICLADLSPSLTPSPACCILSHPLHKFLYSRSESNKCLQNCTTFLQTPFSDTHWFHLQLLNQTWFLRLRWDFSTLLPCSQDRKQKFVSSGPLAPDQPMHSVCSSHPGRGARQ